MTWYGIAAFVAVLAQPAAIQTGSLVEKVACLTDATQTYTLYLPPTYTPQRRWPVLFVFDPRGRGTLAAQIFRPAAERLGWIIASADNTRSDGPWEPNRRALVAMWPDVLTRYSVDERRIYAAGFSGGAGVATALANSSAHLSGIIAAGAPDPGNGEQTPAVAWFGAAGRLDFNYINAKSNDERMRRAGHPRRVEFFDGTHQWLPESMATRAAGWLEALAMKDGRRAADQQLASELRDADLAAGEQLEQSGRITEALDLYQSIAETFGDLADVSAARSRIDALKSDPKVLAARRDEERLDRDERSHEGRLAAALADLRGDEVPMLPALLSKLRLDSLRHEAQVAAYKGESAQRALELIFVQTSFYVWREFEDKKDYARAALCLEIAAAIHADRPRIWYDLAAARAALRDRRSAFTALGRAVDAGYNDRKRLDEDPRFDPLRRDEEFARIAARLK